MDMGRPDLMAERRLRLANSSPDVKALFNAPAYLYNLEPQEPNVDTFSIASDLDYWTPTQLVPIVCSIFLKAIFHHN